MKTKLFSGIALVMQLLCFSQTVPAPAIVWQTALGGSSTESGNYMKPTADGGFVVVGTTYSTDGHVTGNHGGGDVWVVKLNALGVMEWRKCFGGTSTDNGMSIDQTADGGYVAVGRTFSTDGQITDNSGGTDLWIVRMSATGDLLWQKTFGGSGTEQANSVAQTTDGGYIIAGYTLSNNGDVNLNNGDSDAWVIKLSSSGLLHWKKTYGGPQTESAHSIQQTSDGGYIFVGQCGANGGNVNGSHGGADAWVVKLNSLGNIEWQKAMGGTGSDFFNNVKQAPDGGYIMAGGTASNNGDVTATNGQEDYWVVKLNLQGLITWQRTYGGTAKDLGYNVSLTADGGYIVCGESASNANILGTSGTIDGWVLKLDGDGIVQWSKVLGGSAMDTLRAVTQTTSGGYLMAGYSLSNDGDITANQGGADIWVVHLASDNLGSVDFADTALLLYPNPATTEIRLSLPDHSTADSISIFDITGKQVAEQKGPVQAVDVEKLAGGVYVVRVVSGGEGFVGKFVKR